MPRVNAGLDPSAEAIVDEVDQAGELLFVVARLGGAGVRGAVDDRFAVGGELEATLGLFLEAVVFEGRR